MSADPRSMLVAWKVATLAPGLASVRYRAGGPMLGLESAGVRGRLFASCQESSLDGVDVLVIVKSFSPDDLRLAQAAAARGIPVVYDLCDNIFVDGYGSGRPGPTPAEMFLAIVEHASCVVTTTQPLADVIIAQGVQVPVTVIPDGIETPDLVARIDRSLREAAATERAQQGRIVPQRVRNAMRRVRTEGVSVIPALVDSAARSMGRSLAGRVRKRLHPVPMAAGPARAQAAVGAVVAGNAHPDAGRIVWFGNHGADHASFGMLDILHYRAALERVAAEHDVELVVVSNNRGKFSQHIAPLAIPSRYLEWSHAQVEQVLAGAAVAIVPNTLDPFSICKSPNRAVFALSRGVPVVATLTPALQPLANFIHAGDAVEGLRRCLVDPAGSRRQALEGARQASVLFGPAAIRDHWLGLLRALPPTSAGAAGLQPTLAVVLHLVQDLDLALPILKEARDAGITCQAWCSCAVVLKSPRVLAMLRAERIPLRVLPDEKALQHFSPPAATRMLLTVAESNLGPHRVPRMVSEIALRHGIFVATLQHGFENIGLTYDDPIQGLDKVDIAASRIYTWGPLDTLHPQIAASVRARCVPMGCPKEVGTAAVADLLPQGRPIVGVFENLHWHRYSDAYRRAFVANVESLARAFPQVLFVIKPHHAGMWLTRMYDGDVPCADNLLLIDPQAPGWERHTASALLAHMDAVVTSPSTVALDAARLGLPVAVVAEHLRLDNYAPLTALESAPDWARFVACALDPQGRPELQQRSSRFVGRVLMPGNAARRIVEDLRAAASA